MVAPLVTVGIPFRNEGEKLELAIRSVFAQTYPNWELILVDDGADDQTRTVAERHLSERVRYVSDGQNLGLAARLNQITRMANGEYIARMDADDVMHPERLERQVSYLEANPEIEVLGTAAYIIDAENRVVGIRFPKVLPSPKANMDLKVPFIHPTLMARRQWMLRNPYDESYRRAQDSELWARTRLVSMFANLQEPLLFYRESGVFSLAKYRMNLRAGRKIILRYGPSTIGVVPTAVGILRSYFRLAVYTIGHVMGVTERLLERRRQNIPLEEKLRAEKILRAIQ